MAKKIVIIVSIFVLTAGFLMAGGQKEKTVKPEDIKGKMSIWLGYGETLSAYKKAQKIFEAKYPNVKVEILTFALHEYEAKLATSMVTKSGPDLLTFHDYILPRYFDSGSYDPAPKDLAEIVNDPAKIEPAFKKMVSRDGIVYGVPYWTGRGALFYNKDHFKEAGLLNPPATVKEYWADTEKLVKKDQDGNIIRAGATMRLTGPSGGIQKFSLLYFQMSGEQIFEIGDKIGKVRISIDNNLDTAAQALMDRVNHLHGVHKVDDWKLKHDAQAFAAGLASMLFRETWVISYTKKNGPNINFGVALMPKGKVHGAFNYFESLLVNKDSKLKTPTWDFVRIMQQPEIINTILEDSGYIPLRKDIDYSAILAHKPHYKTLMNPPSDYILYTEAPDIAYEEVTIKTGEVVQQAYRDASLVNNLEGCKKAMLKARDTAAKILKDAGIYSK